MTTSDPNPITPDSTPSAPVSNKVDELREKVARKRGIKGFTTTGKQLPYDSSHLYMQMGAAVAASDLGRKAIRRIAQLLDDVQVSRDSQIEALLAKLNTSMNRTQLETLEAKLDALQEAEAAVTAAVNKIFDRGDEWKQFELLMQRFIALKEREVVPLIAKAYGELNSAMVWYRKMLEAHRTADQQEFLPVLEELQKLVKKLNEARESKVASALAMEERFSKTRRAYWAETRGKVFAKQANQTHPVEHENLPFPVDSVTPVVALDPKQLLEQAADAIRQKSKLKSEAKQAENAEKEHGTE
jgi:hypothetical protein